MNAMLLALMLGQDAKMAPPSLRLPPQVMAESGAFFRVVAETNCRRLRWKCDGITRIPSEWLADPNKNFAGAAPAGTYRLTCEGTLNDEWVEASCLVIVGQQPPAPIPPQPPPGPAPWQAELQSLYAADRDPQKAAYKDKLVSLWSGVSGAALRDASLTTVGSLTAKLHSAAQAYPYELKDEHLATIRQRLAKEVTDRIGKPDTPMTDDVRKRASALFSEFVTALQGVK